jgi:predicted nucleic-acid-binding protein
MGLYPVAVCFSERQDNRIQYNNISDKITYNTQDSPLYAKSRKITNTYYVLLRQKRVKPIVDELVLKTTRYTKR